MIYPSICEKPTEIDARVIETQYDWMYSNSILVHPTYDDDGVPIWNIGASKNG